MTSIEQNKNIKKQKIDNNHHNKNDDDNNDVDDDHEIQKECDNCSDPIISDDDEGDDDNKNNVGQTCDICGFEACEDCSDPRNVGDGEMSLFMPFLGKRYCYLHGGGCFETAMESKTERELYDKRFLHFYDMLDSKRKGEPELAVRALTKLWDDYLSKYAVFFNDSTPAVSSIIFDNNKILFKYNKKTIEEKCEKCGHGPSVLFCDDKTRTMHWSFISEKKK